VEAPPARPVVVIDGRQLTDAEMETLGRNLKEALRRGWGVRKTAPPRLLLDLAVAADRAFPGTCGTGRRSFSAGQGTGAEPRNSRARPEARASGQPARTLCVKEAAQAIQVSESYVRRLIRDEVLEVRDGQWPYAIYADSLAAWQERRSRKEADRKAA
jgi:hypothetical protein